MVEVTIYDNNLRPFLIGIGWVCEYAFDADDWEAVSQGIRDTEAESDRWFEYEFCGRDRVPFSVAFDDNGSGMVLVRISLPEALEPQAWMLGRFCREFSWRGS